MKTAHFCPVVTRLTFAKLFIALATAAPSCAWAAQADTAPNPFAGGVIWQIHVELSVEEFAAMQPRGRMGFPG
jgi:hypothetical protein